MDYGLPLVRERVKKCNEAPRIMVNASARMSMRVRSLMKEQSPILTLRLCARQKVRDTVLRLCLINQEGWKGTVSLTHE